ncbi:MAG: hypothetical protein VX293_04275 [Candidatus Latescibacterota bacterium]|nr:hypothetical protein [Candidatus Latescibacterota bacterium]
MSDLLSLTLCKVDRPLKIHSRLLAADLWLVPAGTTGKFDAPAYSPDECRLLQALELAPDELKAIHLTKKFFQGDLILADDIESLRPLYRRLLSRYREIEKCYEAGEYALETELQQRARQLSHLLTRVSQLEKQS